MFCILAFTDLLKITEISLAVWTRNVRRQFLGFRNFCDIPQKPCGERVSELLLSQCEVVFCHFRTGTGAHSGKIAYGMSQLEIP